MSMNWVIIGSGNVLEPMMYQTNTSSNADVLSAGTYGSGHETAAVLLPGFAINWYIAKPDNKTATVSWPDPYLNEHQMMRKMHLKVLYKMLRILIRSQCLNPSGDEAEQILGQEQGW